MKMNNEKIKFWLTLCMFVMGGGLVAAEPEELTKLKDGYLNAHVEALKPLTDKYMKALADLKKQLSQKGDLDGVLAVESEEKGVNNTAVKDQPKRLVAMREVYERNRNAISVKVTKKYLVGLKNLEKKLTKKGDFEGAMVVRGEYQKQKEQNEYDGNPLRLKGVFPVRLEDFKEYLIGTGWSFNANASDNPLVFKKDGTFANRGLTCHYEVTGVRQVIIIWGGGTRVRCQISKDWEKMQELDGGRGTLWRVAR